MKRLSPSEKEKAICLKVLRSEEDPDHMSMRYLSEMLRRQLDVDFFFFLKEGRGKVQREKETLLSRLHALEPDMHLDVPTLRS